MTSIHLNALPQRQRGGSASAAGSRQTRLNERLAVFLSAFVAFAPVPLGGARPLFWTICGAIIAVTLLIYSLSLWRRRETFRIGLASLFPLSVPWTALLAFLAIQAAPVAGLTGPLPVTGAEGQIFFARTISLTPGETILMALRMAGYGCFFFVALQAAANRDRALRIGKWLAYIVAAHALYGLLALTQFGDPLLFVEKWAYQGSATGTFVNRNSYATFLAIGLVLSTALAMRTLLNTGHPHLRKGQRSQVFQAAPFLVAALVILAALFASESRMGLFAGLCGTGFVVVVGLVKGQFHSRGLAVAGLMLVSAVLAIAAVLFSGGTLERLGSVERDGDVRMQLYAQVWDMIGERWLTGFGGGSFEVAYTLFHREPVSPDMVWHKAHSTYLTLWSELGIFAGTLPMIIFAMLAGQAVSMLISRKQDWWLPLIALGTLLVIGIHSLVDFSMEISGNVYLVLMVLALGVAQQRRRGRGTREDPSEPPA